MLNELLAIACCVAVGLISSVVVCWSVRPDTDSAVDPRDEEILRWLNERNRNERL